MKRKTGEGLGSIADSNSATGLDKSRDSAVRCHHVRQQVVQVQVVAGAAACRQTCDDEVPSSSLNQRSTTKTDELTCTFDSSDNPRTLRTR